jgi:hypothetical protein
MSRTITPSPAKRVAAALTLGLALVASACTLESGREPIEIPLSAAGHPPAENADFSFRQLSLLRWRHVFLIIQRMHKRADE